MKNIRRLISTYVWKWKWLNQANSVNVPKIAASMLSVDNPLILAPHADDELIGCNSIIKQGTVIYMNYSRNDKNAEVRKDEIRNYCKSQEAKLICLNCPPENCVCEIKSIVENGSYNQIFLPCYIDWHPEHRATNRVLLEALKLAKVYPDIIWYQVSLPLRARLLNQYTPMSKSQFECKWNMFKKFYKSQAALPYHRFMAVERMSGRYFNVYAAEVYCRLSFIAWSKLIRKFDDYCIDYTEVYNNLNDIQFTTRWVNTINL